jgi:putative ABC transport system ATP-binding protein
MSTAIVEWRDVVKRFGRGSAEVTALAGVSLAVRPGELVAITGPSGSGKSTLLHLAGGLEQPSAGRVLIGGDDLDGMSAAALAALRRTRVAYVFQRLNLLPSLTALENVMLPLELDGVAAGAARRRATEALDRAGLTGSPDRFPDDLSGGEQQRVAIARAIVAHHELLLADEPTGSLDTTTGDRVMDLLAGLCAEGTAVVLVTHEPRYAAWADRVVFLRDGLVADEAVAPPVQESTSRVGTKS